MRWLSLAAAALVALAVAPPADADLSGEGCTATINDESVAGRDPGKKADAISIPRGEDVAYTLTSDRPVVSWTMRFHYGPFAIPVVRGTPETPEDPWVESDRIGSDLYNWMGRGLYRLSAQIDREDGTSCDGAVLIDIQGNPVASLMGVIGLVMIVGALVGLTLGFIQNSHPEKAVSRRGGRREGHHDGPPGQQPPGRPPDRPPERPREQAPERRPDERR